MPFSNGGVAWKPGECAEYVAELPISDAPYAEAVQRFLEDALGLAILPNDWVATRDDAGKLYFANGSTWESRWEHPGASNETMLELAKACQECLAVRESDRDDWLRKLYSSWTKKAETELGKWKPIQHETGVYYYHETTRETTWENPEEELLAPFKFKLTALRKLFEPDYVDTLMHGTATPRATDDRAANVTGNQEKKGACNKSGDAGHQKKRAKKRDRDAQQIDQVLEAKKPDIASGSQKRGSSIENLLDKLGAEDEDENTLRSTKPSASEQAHHIQHVAQSANRIDDTMHGHEAAAPGTENESCHSTSSPSHERSHRKKKKDKRDKEDRNRPAKLWSGDDIDGSKEISQRAATEIAHVRLEEGAGNKNEAKQRQQRAEKQEAWLVERHELHDEINQFREEFSLAMRELQQKNERASELSELKEGFVARHDLQEIRHQAEKFEAELHYKSQQLQDACEGNLVFCNEVAELRCQVESLEVELLESVTRRNELESNIAVPFDVSELRGQAESLEAGLHHENEQHRSEIEANSIVRHEVTELRHEAENLEGELRLARERRQGESEEYMAFRAEISQLRREAESEGGELRQMSEQCQRQYESETQSREKLDAAQTKLRMELRTAKDAQAAEVKEFRKQRRTWQWRHSEDVAAKTQQEQQVSELNCLLEVRQTEVSENANELSEVAASEVKQAEQIAELQGLLEVQRTDLLETIQELAEASETRQAQAEHITELNYSLDARRIEVSNTAEKLSEVVTSETEQLERMSELRHVADQATIEVAELLEHETQRSGDKLQQNQEFKRLSRASEQVQENLHAEIAELRSTLKASESEKSQKVSRYQKQIAALSDELGILKSKASPIPASSDADFLQRREAPALSANHGLRTVKNALAADRKKLRGDAGSNMHQQLAKLKHVKDKRVPPDDTVGHRLAVKATTGRWDRSSSHAARRRQCDRDCSSKLLETRQTKRLLNTKLHGIVDETMCTPPSLEADGNSERQAALLRVRIDGLTLRDLSDAFRCDRDIVLAAVNANGFALAYAAEELRKDRQVVLTAVTSRGLALACAVEELRGDAEIVTAAVRSHGLALHHASDALRNNPELVQAAVQSHGLALQYASEQLRGNRSIVLAAVQSHGVALIYASQQLRQDPEVLCASSSGAVGAVMMRPSSAPAGRKNLVPNSKTDAAHVNYPWLRKSASRSSPDKSMHSGVESAAVRERCSSAPCSRRSPYVSPHRVEIQSRGKLEINLPGGIPQSVSPIRRPTRHSDLIAGKRML